MFDPRDFSTDPRTPEARPKPPPPPRRTDEQIKAMLGARARQSAHITGAASTTPRNGRGSLNAAPPGKDRSPLGQQRTYAIISRKSARAGSATATGANTIPQRSGRASRTARIER